VSENFSKRNICHQTICRLSTI